MTRHILLLMLMLLLTATVVTGEQPSSSPCTVDYVNKNRYDDSPLVFQAIAGQVVADAQPVAGVCLGLFTDTDHRLVESATTDAKGHFKFTTIEPGDYHIVTQFSNCGGNTPVKIVKHNFATKLIHRRQLTITMRPYAYGDCVYATYKDF